MKNSETLSLSEKSSVVNMSNRGALPIKNIVCAAFFVSSLYLLFIYNGSQNRLHDAQLTGSRYRREAEERVVELQSLEKAKDEFQERCESAKRELNNRVRSVNQQFTMLQSQHRETEADLEKLKQDIDVMRNERLQAENSHAQEFQGLKDQKTAEIEKLTGELQSLSKKNEDVQSLVTNLQFQLSNAQGIQNTLKEQNAQLKQSLDEAQQKLLLPSNQQQGHGNQVQSNQQAVQQNQQQPSHQNQQQEQQQQGQFNFNNNNNNLNQAQQAVNQFQQQNNVDANDVNKDNLAQDQNNDGLADQVKSDTDDTQKKNNLEALNAQNQVKPPNNDEEAIDTAAKEAEKNLLDENAALDNKIPAVNPNDAQQGQILEPVLGGAGDHQAGGGEADGVERMNIRDVEEKREKEEADAIDLKKPLDLNQMGQIQEPGNLENQGGNQEGVGQAKPPVFNGGNQANEDEEQYYQDEDNNTENEEEEEEEEDFEEDVDDGNGAGFNEEEDGNANENDADLDNANGQDENNKEANNDNKFDEEMQSPDVE